MVKFKFTAKASDGRTVTDTILAATPGGARVALADRDLQIIDIREKKHFWNAEITKKRVPRAELMHLSRQLGAFLRAGVPILDAIEVLAEEASNSTMKRSLFQIAETLRAGDSFSAAASVHSNLFPRFYVDMLRSAELTGSLDIVLYQLAEYLEREIDSKNQVKSALAYPAVIFGLGVVVTTILVTFVLPRFERFFASLNARLPLATRILLSASRWLGQWWGPLVIGIAVVTVSVYLFFRSRPGRRVRDRMVLRLPAIGGVLKYVIVERFARVMATMVNAGVPLPDALSIASEGTNNSVYTKGLDRARNEMLQGDGIARPLSRSKLFPAAVIQMVRVGEETGTLDQQLENAADFYEKELEYKIKKLTTLFEPTVIVAIGLMVGFVAIAVVSAMYGIFRQVGSL